VRPRPFHPALIASSTTLRFFVSNSFDAYRTVIKFEQRVTKKPNVFKAIFRSGALESLSALVRRLLDPTDDMDLSTDSLIWQLDSNLSASSL